MQIILLEKVVNLGNLGDIVKVKDGYARNFLIPQGRARRATEANKAEFEARRVELEKAAAAKLAEAQAQGENLSGLVVKLSLQTGQVTDPHAPRPHQVGQRLHRVGGFAHRCGGRLDRDGLRRNSLIFAAF